MDAQEFPFVMPSCEIKNIIRSMKKDYRGSLSWIGYSLERISRNLIILTFSDCPGFNMYVEYESVWMDEVSFSRSRVSEMVREALRDASNKLENKELFVFGLIDKTSTLQQKFSSNKIFDRHLAKLIYSFVE